ncbi:MAG: amidohydrolase [Proteobacteria bacterium]|nr:amidohydrolase [Pseudomonadota bacterium]
MSRREALGLGALLAVPGAALGAPAARAPSALEPDLVLLHANVLTMDDAQPRAEAFAVRDGRFVAVGRSADVRALATRRTAVVDAAGLTVTPGFIDAHCHPGEVEELYDVNADLRSVREIQDALRARARATPPGVWIRAFKFDDTKLADGRTLSRRDLDEAVPDHPVRVDHRGGHTSWFNSEAFRLAGITRSTPDPHDGRYYRDADGELQGEVAENARDAFERVGLREQFTPAEERERARKAMAHMSRLLTAAGLTTVHDAFASSDKIRAYQDAYAAGELLHRAYILVGGVGPDAPYPKLRDAGVYTGLGNEHVRIGPVKFVADGSASERTMRMSTPFVDRPGDYGILTMDQAQIHAAVEDAHRHGWQVGIHANGDVAIDMVLNAYERVQREWPHPDRRHRIEHCSLVNADLVRRIRDSGSIPTPFWTYVYYHGEKWRAYGEEKMRSMFAHRWFLDAGIRVPGASDYSPGPFDPMMALQSLVTRRDYAGRVWGANQRVSVAEALRIGTLHGAYASYEEHVKGSITAGKYADFVVLEQDPHVVDPDRLKDIRVLRTVVGGRTAYERA